MPWNWGQKYIKVSWQWGSLGNMVVIWIFGRIVLACYAFYWWSFTFRWTWLMNVAYHFLQKLTWLYWSVFSCWRWTLMRLQSNYRIHNRHTRLFTILGLPQTVIVKQPACSWLTEIPLCIVGFRPKKLTVTVKFLQILTKTFLKLFWWWNNLSLLYLLIIGRLWI